MSISNDLFMAILAMDSYNRGYDPGLVVSGSQIGNASLLDIELPAGSQGVSFFAQACTINDSSIAGFPLAKRWFRIAD